MTGRRLPAYFIGGGQLAGHTFVETQSDGQPRTRLRVMLTEGPVVRLAGDAQPLPRGRTYGIYQLSDDSADDSLIYEFAGEETE